MRPLLFILVLLCAWQNVSAQKIKFTDSSNEWTYYEQFFVTPTYTFRHVTYVFQNDTIVNGKSYRRLPNYFHLSYLLRYDTTADRVYVLLDSTEQVLYDFNLGVGDTQKVVFKPLKDSVINVVQKVDSVLANGLWYKIWKFIGYRNSYVSTFEVIENIGCMKGLFFPLEPIEFEHFSTLTCFKNNGSMVTVPKPLGNNYIDAKSCASDIRNITTKHQAIVYPNPANASSIARLPYKIREGVLIITNAYGQVVLNKQFENKEELALGNIGTSGIYFYHINDKQSNQTFTGKFIYQ